MSLRACFVSVSSFKHVEGQGLSMLGQSNRAQMLSSGDMFTNYDILRLKGRQIVHGGSPGTIWGKGLSELAFAPAASEIGKDSC